MAGCWPPPLTAPSSQLKQSSSSASSLSRRLRGRMRTMTCGFGRGRRAGCCGPQPRPGREGSAPACGRARVSHGGFGRHSQSERYRSAFSPALTPRPGLLEPYGSQKSASKHDRTARLLCFRSSALSTNRPVSPTADGRDRLGGSTPAGAAAPALAARVVAVAPAAGPGRPREASGGGRGHCSIPLFPSHIPPFDGCMKQFLYTQIFQNFLINKFPNSKEFPTGGIKPNFYYHFHLWGC